MNYWSLYHQTAHVSAMLTIELHPGFFECINICIIKLMVAACMLEFYVHFP
jgi:hypothetical protein